MIVLVIVEHDNTTIKSVILNAAMATEARSSAGVRVLIAGFNVMAVVQAATQIASVAKVAHADDAGLADGLAENLAAQVLAVTANYSHIPSPATASGKSVAPHVAAKPDAVQISDIIRIESFDTPEWSIYMSNAIVLVQLSDAIRIVIVRTTAFEAAAAAGGPGVVETTECVTDNGRSRLVGCEVIVSDRPELASIKIVISGGRALGSAERFPEVVTPLVSKLGAAVGASRAAMDTGCTPSDLRVGQAGKIVAPQLHIALDISGAIQHLTNMKDSKAIVAINKDLEAPTLLIADYGLATDLFIAIPELTKVL